MGSDGVISPSGYSDVQPQDMVVQNSENNNTDQVSQAQTMAQSQSMQDTIEKNEELMSLLACLNE